MRWLVAVRAAAMHSMCNAICCSPDPLPTADAAAATVQVPFAQAPLLLAWLPRLRRQLSTQLLAAAPTSWWVGTIKLMRSFAALCIALYCTQVFSNTCPGMLLSRLFLALRYLPRSSVCLPQTFGHVNGSPTTPTAYATSNDTLLPKAQLIGETVDITDVPGRLRINGAATQCK